MNTQLSSLHMLAFLCAAFKTSVLFSVNYFRSHVMRDLATYRDYKVTVNMFMFTLCNRRCSV